MSERSSFGELTLKSAGSILAASCACLLLIHLHTRKTEKALTSSIKMLPPDDLEAVYMCTRSKVKRTRAIQTHTNTNRSPSSPARKETKKTRRSVDAGQNHDESKQRIEDQNHLCARGFANLLNESNPSAHRPGRGYDTEKRCFYSIKRFDEEMAQHLKRLKIKPCAFICAKNRSRSLPDCLIQHV